MAEVDPGLEEVLDVKELVHAEKVVELRGVEVGVEGKVAHQRGLEEGEFFYFAFSNRESGRGRDFGP